MFSDSLFSQTQFPDSTLTNPAIRGIPLPQRCNFTLHFSRNSCLIGEYLTTYVDTAPHNNNADPKRGKRRPIVTRKNKKIIIGVARAYVKISHNPVGEIERNISAEISRQSEPRKWIKDERREKADPESHARCWQGRVKGLSRPSLPNYVNFRFWETCWRDTREVLTE